MWQGKDRMWKKDVRGEQSPGGTASDAPFLFQSSQRSRMMIWGCSTVGIPDSPQNRLCLVGSPAFCTPHEKLWMKGRNWDRKQPGFLPVEPKSKLHFGGMHSLVVMVWNAMGISKVCMCLPLLPHKWALAIAQDKEYSSKWQSHGEQGDLFLVKPLEVWAKCYFCDLCGNKSRFYSRKSNQNSYFSNQLQSTRVI